MMAVAAVGGPNGLPRLRHGATVTRGLWRMRASLAAFRAVTMNRRSPRWANHMGVDTGSPERRKVVNDANRDRPR